MDSIKWTDESLISAIKEASVNGVCSSAVVGMTVATMARRRFGSFAKACEAAGVKSASAAKKHYEFCTIEGCDSKTRSSGSPYCEVHYYRIRRNGSIALKIEEWNENYCAYCGEDTNGKKYCDSRCAARCRRDVPITIDCVQCGIEFKPYQKNITCSDECKRKHIREQAKTLRALNIDHYREYERNAEYKRKARKRATQHEEVVRDEVFKRDKHKCLICGDKLDHSAVWPDPMFSTLDHILPLSLNGTHTYNNLQSAHLRCNIRKGNRPANDQLLMFG